MALRGLFKKLTFIVGGFCFFPALYAESALNMPRGVTPVSRDIFDLHMLIFWVCVVIGIIVFAIMLYAIIFHRKSRGYKAAKFHDHITVELAWVIVPFIILVLMAIPASKVLIKMNDTNHTDQTVKITGYQWKWRYDYLKEDIGFFSNLSTPQAQIQGKEPKGPYYLLEVDKPLVLPIKQKIRLLVTSNDVIHSWWVPQLGVKRDAVPGFIHESWVYIDEPGIYRGQCTELCGINHGFMPVVVEALTQADYDKWITGHKQQAQQAQPDKTWTKEELMTLGEKSYGTYCAVCHQVNGEGMGDIYPALKKSKIALGPIKKHIDLVLHGVQGTAMQGFIDQLTDDELAAIITFERNAWGNDTGDAVQPSDIRKLRKGDES